MILDARTTNSSRDESPCTSTVKRSFEGSARSRKACPPPAPRRSAQGLSASEGLLSGRAPEADSNAGLWPKLSLALVLAQMQDLRVRAVGRWAPAQAHGAHL
jgi:hypothetical protein